MGAARCGVEGSGELHRDGSARSLTGVVWYVEYAPTAALRPYVRCFWVVRTAGVGLDPACHQRVLPDGCMDIILALAGPDPAARDAWSLTAVGAMTRYLDATPVPLRLGARFEPGMGALFLCAPARALTDLEVPLVELWGADGRRLLAEIAARPSIAERIRALEGWLLRRLAAAGAPDAEVMAAVQRILAGGGRQPVHEVLRTVRCSERQLRRRFDVAVGIGPKHLARIVRLQEAVRHAASADTGSWASIAAAAGYYDQPHMIAEFRALAGRTPVEQLGSRV